MMLAGVSYQFSHQLERKVIDYVDFILKFK